MGNKFKSAKRCALSNKIINGKEVIITDYALDYVRKIGYTPIPTEKMEQIKLEIQKRRIPQINKLVAISLLFMFVFFLIPVINAKVISTTQTTQFSEGYNIKYPTLINTYQNESHDFYFHVFNISNGKPIDNSTTSCYFHMYSETTGEHIWNQTAIHETFKDVSNEWEIELNHNNFTSLGLYSYILQCNNSFYGGYITDSFDVIEKPHSVTIIPTTKSIFTLDFSKSINLIGYIILLGIVFLLFMFKAYNISGGLLMLSGLLLVFNQVNLILGLLIVVIGGVVLFKSNES